MSKTLLDNLANISNQKNTYLIPNNIKNGVQIFDITGNYSGESSNYDVKMFDTVANMQNDSSAQLDDLAIVYNNISNNFDGIYQYGVAYSSNIFRCAYVISDFNKYIGTPVSQASDVYPIYIRIPNGAENLCGIGVAILGSEYEFQGVTYNELQKIYKRNSYDNIAYDPNDGHYWLVYTANTSVSTITNETHTIYENGQIITDSISRLSPDYSHSQNIFKLYDLGTDQSKIVLVEHNGHNTYYAYSDITKARDISITGAYNADSTIHDAKLAYNAYNFAKTQFTVTAENIYNAIAFGQNGPINGTLQQTNNLTVEQVVTRANLYSDLSTLILDNSITNLVNFYRDNTNIVHASRNNRRSCYHMYSYV